MMNFLYHRNFYRTGWCFLIAVLALGAWYGYVYRTLPMIPSHVYEGVFTLKWPVSDIQAVDIAESVFKKHQDDIPAVNMGPLAKRFRLAGTFFAIDANQRSQKAIIDDLKKKIQQMVSVGEMLDKTVKVISIFQDSIILREGHNEEELWLSFSRAGSAQEKAGPDADTANGQAGALAMLNRFGKRVGETRWVLKRTEILNYYQELLDNTERLAKVFESLKPIYRGKAIEGYVLDIEGESDMFHAFGLKQDDIIRKVNSMPMTSRFRAEYFINEFVKNRANGFVMDIERDATKKKLIYLIR